LLLGILSDTHDSVDRARAAVAYLADQGAEALVHAGDIVAPFTARVLAEPGLPVFAVFGNNDGEVEGLRAVLPGIARHLETSWDGRTAAVVHDIGQLRPEAWERVDVVIHGHTHRAAVEEQDGVLVVNPGEVCGWITGQSTVALLDTKDLTAWIREVDAEP